MELAFGVLLFLNMYNNANHSIAETKLNERITWITEQNKKLVDWSVQFAEKDLSLRDYNSLMKGMQSTFIIKGID